MPDVELDDVLARDDEEGLRELLRVQRHRQEKALVETHSVDGTVQAHEERHQHEANAKYMPTLAEERNPKSCCHSSAEVRRKSVLAWSQTESSQCLG